MTRIRTIPPAEAGGALKEVYDRISNGTGNVHAVHQAASLHPEYIEAHLQFYKTLMYGKGALSLREREIVATAVSAVNGCGLCTASHKAALSKVEKDPALLEALATTPDTMRGLSPREEALVTFVLKLTRAPGAVGDKDVEALRAAGLDDREVLATVTIASYFNFMNRFALGLGVTG